jgi:hypothetical protein
MVATTQVRFLVGANYGLSFLEFLEQIKIFSKENYYFSSFSNLKFYFSIFSKLDKLIFYIF